MFSHVSVRPSVCPPPPDLLHGGRYASCVHAGGLSCFKHMVTVSGQSKIEIFKCNIIVVAYPQKSGKFTNSKLS